MGNVLRRYASGPASSCLYLGAALLIHSAGALSAPTTFAVPPEKAATRQESETSSMGLPDFTAMVERCAGAVVNIDVVQQSKQIAIPGIAPDQLQDFFGRFGLPVPDAPAAEQQGAPTHASGSGFIVSADGYILTNSHLVADVTQVVVRLLDKREFAAKVVGADPNTDVALLKIDATGLPMVRIGDPHKLRAGEWVLAIGSPFGFDNSVTAGIVSATARAVSSDTYVSFIQTDVSVNPGNSGGPLFNLKGEVVGINSMIFSRTGGYMGLSFAIPIDVATHIRDQLIESGSIVRGRIGIRVQDVTPQLASSFGLTQARGALVSAVEVGGPADRAGVKIGDVIASVDTQRIQDSIEVSRGIAELRPGSWTSLEVWRGGQAQAIKVEVIRGGTASAPVNASPETLNVGNTEVALGVEVRALTAEEQRLMNVSGLIIDKVSGPAATAGLQSGDVLLGINDTRVGSVQDLRDRLAGLQPHQNVALLIKRAESQIFVPLRLGT